MVDQPAQGTRGEFFERVRLTAAAVVDRYLEDDRPFDETLSKTQRAKLEAAVVGALSGPADNAGLRARARDILRAWELLRDDAWWADQPEAQRRACVRLAWLVAQPERVEARLERAGETPQWEETEGEAQ